jgi:hypothetical protein
MRTLGRWILAGSLLAVGTARDAAAQHPQNRHGFWFGLGVGLGSLSWTCDACPNLAAESGPSGYLKVGLTMTPQVLFGLELNGWRGDVAGTMATNVNGSFVSYVYLKPTGGFFLKGGMGVSLYHEDGPERFQSDTLSTSGFGLTAGLGYDWRVGSNISLTPVGNFMFGSMGHIRHSGHFYPGVQQSTLQLALGVTVH